ncbi:DNA-binding protein RFX8 isoform X2 [Elephas maximus indicus]|uniref:DNA-binding protein RFX8 isoform X2 n=1 Tax=Elephas maximus indicus TaxID=99487 RepID=UPI002116FD3D|nr:DNA-binding protein RFX8 isoform X2 [Elephas maximus indicus]
MAESVPASPSGGESRQGLHSAIMQWLLDNFCICEGYSVPRCLIYEIYMETCGQNPQNQVNPATFGKLVHLVFPDLGTRRLGTRGSARYHYDGICIKKSSFFYAQYRYLLGEKRYQSEDVAGFEGSRNYNNITQQEGKFENHSSVETDPDGPPLPEFRRCPFWEQELAKKYSYRMMAFLADEYRNYCQDILQIVRNQELERVGDFLTSFWKSLQQDTVMFMSLPDVCQLLKCYDVQLYKASGSKEEFIKLAASFQLRWNFLLTAVSKAMTLCHRDSFGSWHLFHLLLLEYVIHVLQSSVEEDVENLDEVLSDDQSLIQPHQALFYPPDSSPTQECESPRGEPPQLMLKHTSQSWCAAGLSSMTLRVLGFLVDTATGNQSTTVSPMSTGGRLSPGKSKTQTEDSALDARKMRPA